MANYPSFAYKATEAKKILWTYCKGICGLRNNKFSYWQSCIFFGLSWTNHFLRDYCSVTQYCLQTFVQSLETTREEFLQWISGRIYTALHMIWLWKFNQFWNNTSLPHHQKISYLILTFLITWIKKKKICLFHKANIQTTFRSVFDVAVKEAIDQCFLGRKAAVTNIVLRLGSL